MDHVEAGQWVAELLVLGVVVLVVRRDVLHAIVDLELQALDLQHFAGVTQELGVV
jgi:hypothetical protein